MRLRRKPHLFERMERASAVLVREPETLRGQWKSAFGEFNAVHAELGCGKGRFTIETAKNAPDTLTVGLERIQDALVIAMERGLDVPNLRFISGDASRLLEMFAPGELSRIYINFCDPWHKVRHAHRRLTAPGFLALYREILAPDGEMRFRTDNIPLFEYSMETLKSAGWILSDVTRDLHRDIPDGVMTDYEAKFRENGVSICALKAKIF